MANYNRQTFVDGETVLSADHMNHIEDGIEQVSLGLDVVGSRLSTVENSLGLEGDAPGVSLMTVRLQEGSKMTIRCKDWTDDRDFVWEFGGVCGTNKTANLWYSSTVEKALEDSALTWGIGNMSSKSQLYKMTTDDTAPVQFNGSYFGGNHAMTGSTDFTVTSHNMTEADIGSIWKDSDAEDTREYMLVKIKSPTVLAFINMDPQCTSGNGAFNYAKHTPIAPLVHVRNATHTDNISFEKFTNSQQLHPGANNVTNKYYVDDVEITEDGIYMGNKVHNVCHYSIPNVKAIIEYLEANVGNNTNTSYYSDDIKEKYMDIELIHEFRPNGSQTTYCKYMIDPSNALNFSYIYAAQVAPFGKPSYLYAPGTFNDEVFLHDASASIQFKPANWNVDGIPPYRYFTFNEAKDKGFQIVYNRDTYWGNPERRGTRVSSGSFAGWSPATCKLYPIFTRGTFPAGSSFDSVTGRIPLNMSLNDGTTAVGWYWEHDDIIMTIDSHEICTDARIKLPSYMQNKRIEVLDMTDSVISYPPYRTSDILHYATNAAIGHLVLRLYD